MNVNAALSVWRPPYPSENLKTPRFVKNSDKIYERGLTPQVGMNPFLKGNYLQDLETQNQFLKPLNSNLN